MIRKGLIYISPFLLLSIFIFSCKTENRHSRKDGKHAQIDSSDFFFYGFFKEDFTIDTAEVKPNESLSNILEPYGIGSRTIHNLAQLDSVYDVRRIRAGDTYYVLNDKKDSTAVADYLILENSKLSYVVFDLRDSRIEVFEKEIDRVMKSSSGVISSSLWNAMMANNDHPILAVKLADVYAWAVDFYGIQKGDYYKVNYEELKVEDETVDIGRVQSAVFHHMERDYYAFYFVQDSVGDYFDEDGNSLMRTFLKAPLRYSRISSKFSNSRLHPVLRIRRPHHGVDYAAPRGTHVYAIGDGKVTQAGRRGGAGNMITIKHNTVYTTKYLHLWKFAKGIRAGVAVKQGDLIGYVGSTGLSTGPHLDFRFYKNGAAIDPLKVESPPAKPVKPEHMDRYKAFADSLKAQIDVIEVELTVDSLETK